MLIDGKTPYELLGGQETIRKLVNAFYPRVMANPHLRPIFPDDITEVMHKQELFLTQFLGGPALYSEKYGPPRLRARHMPFEITPLRAEAWLHCMRDAMDEIGLEGPVRDFFYERLTQVAYFMVNS